MDLYPRSQFGFSAQSHTHDEVHFRKVASDGDSAGWEYSRWKARCEDLARFDRAPHSARRRTAQELGQGERGHRSFIVACFFRGFGVSGIPICAPFAQALNRCPQSRNSTKCPELNRRLGSVPLREGRLTERFSDGPLSLLFIETYLTV